VTEGGLQTGPPVVLLQDVVARAAQVVRHEVGDGRVVLDQQDALVCDEYPRAKPTINAGLTEC
jgi:hypothetical protein